MSPDGELLCDSNATIFNRLRPLQLEIRHFGDLDVAQRRLNRCSCAHQDWFVETRLDILTVCPARGPRLVNGLVCVGDARLVRVALLDVACELLDLGQAAIGVDQSDNVFAQHPPHVRGLGGRRDPEPPTVVRRPAAAPKR